MKASIGIVFLAVLSALACGCADDQIVGAGMENQPPQAKATRLRTGFASTIFLGDLLTMPAARGVNGPKITFFLITSGKMRCLITAYLYGHYRTMDAF